MVGRRMVGRRGAGRVLAAVAAAVASLALGVGSASAGGQGTGSLRPAGYRVVTLGDSYASGEGAPAPAPAPWVGNAFGDSGVDGCHRSAIGGHALFGRAAAHGRGSYVDAACSGATTAGVVAGSNGEPSQLLALGRATRVVTLSAGANDVGFSQVAGACTVGVATHDLCLQALAVSSAQLAAFTAPAAGGGPSPLEAFYRTVQSRAPRARLLVTGYPQLFPTDAATQASPACAAVYPDAQAALNSLALSIDAAFAATSARVGATYVDLVGPFTGHASCGAAGGAWINTVDPVTPVFSFHPNATGQAAIATALRRAACRAGLPV